MRCAPLLAALLWSGAAAAAPEFGVVSARYTEPTTRYDHGILGDAVEYGALEMVVDRCPACAAEDLRTVTLRLSTDRVFEDVAPRLVDVDGDGTLEVIVVETQLDTGARLAIYSGDGSLYAATPHIGQAHRWLAPIGAADMDGDGLVEIAYIDRPHLAKTLRVWRVANGALTEIAALEGVTNHRIGEADIGGGMRDCGQGPELVVATADWTRVVSVRLVAGGLDVRDIGPHRDRRSFAAALACEG